MRTHAGQTEDGDRCVRLLLLLFGLVMHLLVGYLTDSCWRPAAIGAVLVCLYCSPTLTLVRARCGTQNHNIEIPQVVF